MDLSILARVVSAHLPTRSPTHLHSASLNPKPDTHHLLSSSEVCICYCPKKQAKAQSRTWQVAQHSPRTKKLAKREIVACTLLKLGMLGLFKAPIQTPFLASSHCRLKRQGMSELMCVWRTPINFF